MIRTILRALLAPALVAAALLCVASTPAQAASCKGTGCAGKDPAVYCPSGAVTKNYKTFEHWSGTEAYWQKRVHDGCQTAWVRLVVNTYDVSFGYMSFQGRVQSKRFVASEDRWVFSVNRDTPVISANGFNQEKTGLSMMVPMPDGQRPSSRYCWRWRTDRAGADWNAWECSGWN